MLLLDSLYVNSGGARVLLDYLVDELEKRGGDAFYLFDERCSAGYADVPSERKLFLKATLHNRRKFYQQNVNKFSSVLCFGNIPPSRRLAIPVYVYFHQTLYVDSGHRNLCVLQTGLLRLKIAYLHRVKQNADFWLVQNEWMAQKLSKKFTIDPDKILLMPFYSPVVSDGNRYERMPHTYLYVSAAPPHKNHERLLRAFCAFYDKHGQGELIITVPDNTPAAMLAQKKSAEGYPIVNIGFIERDKLYKHYHRAEYLVFPSLTESFGLGIVEAIDNGCKVIGADYPYMHQVCKPSIVFNPMDEEDMVEAFEKSLSNEVEASQAKIDDGIDRLIKLITK